jgi:hypothetical protein
MRGWMCMRACVRVRGTHTVQVHVGVCVSVREVTVFVVS